LKYLFGQETKERAQSEIVFAITPHIIRGGEVTDENLKMLDIGSANNVTYRRDDSKVASVSTSPVQPIAKVSDKPSAGIPTARP
jgi:general secretion pathway protein D